MDQIWFNWTGKFLSSGFFTSVLAHIWKSSMSEMREKQVSSEKSLSDFTNVTWPLNAENTSCPLLVAINVETLPLLLNSNYFRRLINVIEEFPLLLFQRISLPELFRCPRKTWLELQTIVLTSGPIGVLGVQHYHLELLLKKAIIIHYLLFTTKYDHKKATFWLIIIWCNIDSSEVYARPIILSCLWSQQII